MVGGFSVSGRGPLWARVVAGLIALGGMAVLAPKPFPDLSYTSAHGAWLDTLASSLFVNLALACSIPMLRPDVSRYQAGQAPAADADRRPQPG
jgi:hypothetical protein